MTKSSSVGLLTIWLMTLCGGVLGAAGTFWLPLPRPEAWPYLFASAWLHLAYMLFLVRAYGLGDLSRVYPIARGSAPVVVALLAIVFVGEWPSAAQLGGLLLCCGAIASLAFADPGQGEMRGGALRAALLTGLMIASYTVVDGQGARLAGTPFSYIAWNLLLDAIPITFVVALRRRGSIVAFVRNGAWHGIGGGVMAAIGYGIVVWAMSQSPMAGIASLRETSVVFAAWIGARLLGEPFGGRRIAAAGGVAVGLAIQYL